MSTVSIKNDTDARNKIVSMMNRNFFVEAGAGSGKTTMLVNRMIAMVESGIDISKICAITFTKAAAGEFYERFQKKLIERSNPDYVWEDKGIAGQLPETTEKTREYCARALQNIDLCFMGTIDSFCSMILSEHPYDAGVPSDAGVIEDESAKLIYGQIYPQICNGKHGDHIKELAENFGKFYWNPKDVFMNCIETFMTNRNAKFQFDNVKVIDVDVVYKRERDEIINALTCLMQHPELKHDTKESSGAWEKLSDAYYKLKNKWSDDIAGVIKGLDWLKKLCIIPDALNKYAISLGSCFRPKGKTGQSLEFIHSQSGGILETLVKMQYSASMLFLTECVPVIESFMKNKGIMSYFDCLYYLRNMLKNDAATGGKLIRYINERHSYYLIDEFQDTNPMQAEVFFYLSSEHPVEQWKECVPRQGSLFIVGDPKQSIYRFRGADVTSFLNVKKIFEDCGGEILQLTRNFRSTRSLSEKFNSMFQVLLPEETDVQSKFEEIPLPNDTLDEFQGVYTYEAYTREIQEDHIVDSEPYIIKKIITNLVGRPEYRISVNGVKRPIKYSDIMIITKSKSNIKPIVKVFEDEKIPTRVEGQVPFERNEALLQVLCIYQAVTDVNNQMAIYTTLKSPLFGFKEEDLVKYCQGGGKISLRLNSQISDDADETIKNVEEAIQKLKDISNRANNLSPVSVFLEILDKYEVYRVTPAENMEVLYYTLELLRSAEKAGSIVSLNDGAKYIQNLVNGYEKEERCLSFCKDKDCVHIANLHKVKGLEAPIVILTSALKSTKGAEYSIVRGYLEAEGYLFKQSSPYGGESNPYTYFSTDAYKDECSNEKDALKAEELRTVYVAATRARNALIMCSKLLKSNKDTMWKKCFEGIEMGAIFDAILENTEIQENEPKEILVDALYKKAQDECVLNSREAEEESYEMKNPSRERISSKITKDDDDAAEDVSELHRFPAVLGTMVHRLMELIVTTKNKLDEVQTVDDILKEYLTPVTQAYEADFSKALKEVFKVINAGGYAQSNGLPQDILNELLGADEVHCEVPFCYKEEGDEVLWNGIMDVVYCKDGKWHIIDYKTNADGTDLDVKYKEQLEAYKRAFKSITGHDADAFTYHIHI